MVNLFSFGCHVVDRAYVPGRINVGWWNERAVLHLMCDAEYDWHERSFRASGALEIFLFANRKPYFRSLISGYNVK